MESGAQELMMNEIVRRLGVTLTPSAWTSRNAKIATDFLSLGSLGVASLGRRQDWRACRKASYFYVACVFIWLDGGGCRMGLKLPRRAVLGAAPLSL